MKHIIGYFAQWDVYDRRYHVKNLVSSGAADRLTVINYAFGNLAGGKCLIGDAHADYQRRYSADESVDGVEDDPAQALKGNFNQLRKLKAAFPHLRVMISIGGWLWSAGFSDAALTPRSRRNVVESCIGLFIRGNLPVDGSSGGEGAAAGVFDGIDIDWEYPAVPGHEHNIFRPEDTQNFTALLAEFRRQLDQVSPDLLLTIAAPSGRAQVEKIEIDKIAQILSWINLMTYDMHGTWDAAGPTNFHSPLYTSSTDPSEPRSSDLVVQAFTAAGVPACNLMLGVPFYGRGWTGVMGANDGLYQPAVGPAPATYEVGVEDYKVLKALGYPGFLHQEARAYWLFDGETFWSCDDPASLGHKMAYVNRMGLGGVMVWELSGDTPEGELIAAIYDGLYPSGSRAGESPEP